MTYYFDSTKEIDFTVFERKIDYSALITSTISICNGRYLRPIDALKTDILEITTTDSEAKLVIGSLYFNKFINSTIILLQPGIHRILTLALSQCIFIEHDLYGGTGEEKINRYSFINVRKRLEFLKSIRKFKIHSKIGNTEICYFTGTIENTDARISISKKTDKDIKNIKKLCELRLVFSKV